MMGALVLSGLYFYIGSEIYRYFYSPPIFICDG